jgi:hypothetical protein
MKRISRSAKTGTAPATSGDPMRFVSGRQVASEATETGPRPTAACEDRGENRGRLLGRLPGLADPPE